MKPITPALLFNSGCREPRDYYLRIFPDAELTSEFPGPDGELVACTLRLRGLEFLLISGGPACSPSVAHSYMVHTADQAETDHFWNAFTEEGEESYCGWLTDKFGISWQITPVRFTELTQSGTPAQIQAVFQAMMTMRKLDVAALEAAWENANK